MGFHVGFIIAMSLLLSTTTSLALDDADNVRTQNAPTASLTMKENPQLCQLCEEFATEAFFYLNENETQTEIINSLHQACSKLHSFQLECARLVDYYAPLFFTKIASLSPEEFCMSVSFCGEVKLIRLPRHEDTCTLCHEVVDEIITNFQDPNIELTHFVMRPKILKNFGPRGRPNQAYMLKIIEILLKGCNNTENFVQKCKRMIIRNAPVILEQVKKFLKKRDFCNSIHVCGGKTAHAGSQVLRSLSTA